MTEPASTNIASPNKPTRSKVLLKLFVTLIVIGFVCWRASSLLAGQDFSTVRIATGWLVLSGVLYACAWLPSIWFFRSLVGRMDRRPEWLLASYAYFAGHLGKYIPGKAGVILIRGALLRERGYSLAAGMMASVYETLLMMGIGLALAIALAPLLVPIEILRDWTQQADRIADARWIPALIVVVGILATLPLVSQIFSTLARRFSTPGTVAPSITTRQIWQGELAFLCSWPLMGLSFGAVLQSLSPESVSLTDWPLWTAAISASVVIGFFAIIVPGGLGVREGIMIEILRVQPDLVPSQVVLAAVLLRLVWLTTEVVVYAALGAAQRRADSQTSASG